MPILTQKGLLLAKVENTAGTDANPSAGSNAVLISNPVFSVQADEVTRNFVRADFSQYASVYVGKRGQMTFTAELRGSGDASDPVGDIGVLLQGCGMALDNRILTPVSDDLDTLTLHMYFDGILHKMRGSMGTFTINAEAGGIATADFTFTGTYVEPDSTTFPTGIAYNETVPPLVESAGLEWNGSSTGLFAASFSLDIANTIALRRDVNSPEGLHSVFISGRNPVGGFTPEVSAALNDSFWADWAAATTRTFEVTIGASAGSQIVIPAPAVQITGLGYGDRDSIKTYDVALGFRRDAGNDEISIEFVGSAGGGS
jgi:hypothetical protein